MKKYLVILILFSFIFLAGCSLEEVDISDAPKTEITENGQQNFLISELGIEIVLPKTYSIEENEPDRRGSYASYSFRAKLSPPTFQEIQLFSEDSIRIFNEKCESIDYPCFFGDYPDLEKYFGQKEAFLKNVNYEDYELIKFNDRNFLVSDSECTGDICVIREYTTFIDDTKIDIWITMIDESQREEADKLFSQFRILAIETEPINNARARVTKKPFGIKVSPDNSPVSPEKFEGYHTGVDFEIFAGEENADISIYAICTGPLTFKNHAKGYGGVAVQQCILDNNDVIVIYGHLKLSSISANLNQTLNQGQQIGILGQGYSKETDGERKHLHLGIRNGTVINLLGYVRDPDRLDEWIDVLTMLSL